MRPVRPRVPASEGQAIDMAANGITSSLYRDLIRPVPSWTLEAHDSTPGHACRLVAAQLANWHLDHLSDDVQHIASELVTQAIGAGADIRLTLHAALSAGHKMLRIEVTGPARTNNDTGQDHLLAGIATDAWGHDHYTTHTLTWAQLPIPTPNEPQLATAA